MYVEMKITRGTALNIAQMIWAYWIEVADDYNGPCFRGHIDGGFRFTTCCGNRWEMFFASDQWWLTFGGSREGWRSKMSAFGADPIPNNPRFARIAGKFLARIVEVQSSGGDHGLDPWLWGHEVAARCREDEALLAPALPYEDLPWRSSFAKAA